MLQDAKSYLADAKPVRVGGRFFATIKQWHELRMIRWHYCTESPFRNQATKGRLLDYCGIWRTSGAQTAHWVMQSEGGYRTPAPV
jgi:hypothetical protein